MQTLQMPENLVNEHMRECIQNCLNCHSICQATIQYCLKQGGPHTEPAHIRLMEDCAEICQTSANFMLRGSDLHALTCGVCAQVCRRCADDCGRMGDDEVMNQCAEACRRCAATCEQMSKGG